MPVDYVKIWLRDAKPRFLENSPLFTKVFEKYKEGDYGERSKLILKYKNLKILIFNSGRVYLQGSLHYYYNNGKHNYNDFNYLNLIDVINELSYVFHFNLENAIILNIEFGMNLRPLFDPNSIINGSILHRKKEFLKPFDFDYRKAEHQRYWIKIYNKGHQFKLPYELLRFELKYKKMKDLNSLGLYSLKDLKNKHLFEKIEILILEKWKECIFYDFTIDTENLKPLQLKKTHLFQKANYWLNLTNKERLRQKKFLKQLSINKGFNIQQEIYNLIQNKWRSLTPNCTLINQCNKGLINTQKKELLNIN